MCNTPRISVEMLSKAEVLVFKIQTCAIWTEGDKPPDNADDPHIHLNTKEPGIEYLGLCFYCFILRTVSTFHQHEDANCTSKKTAATFFLPIVVTTHKGHRCPKAIMFRGLKTKGKHVRAGILDLLVSPSFNVGMRVFDSWFAFHQE